MTRRSFSAAVVKALRDGKVLRIRAGAGAHRFIGIWVVVVEGRAFVRSWSLTPGGWHQMLLEERRGSIRLGTREIPVGVVPTRSERLRKLVSCAYLEKYATPASLPWARGLDRKRRREATLELVPR